MFKLHIVLLEPEIAGNVGAVMRTCMATNSTLHLIQPMGFFLDERFIKRSSVNYVKDVNYVVYDDLADFQNQHPDCEIYYTTGRADTIYSQIDFIDWQGDLYIMFGRESTGINQAVLDANPDRCLRVPMAAKVRSLNLANTVALVAYEILRQRSFQGLI